MHSSKSDIAPTLGIRPVRFKRQGKHIITVTVTGEQLIDKRRGEVRLRKGGIPPVSIRMDPGVEEAL